MFAALPIERELFTFNDLLPGVLYWLEAVGGYALLGLLLWLILGYTAMKHKDRARIPSWVAFAFVTATSLAILGYIAYGVSMLISPPPPPEFTVEGIPIPRKGIDWHDYIGAFGGAFAIFAVLLPIVLSLSSLSARRIWALARLSFKEAIRRRVLWVFSVLIAVCLFASWFITSKPEYQVSTYISVVQWVMSPLLLFTSFLLAAFSIPNDIKQQTIHTILTKPVQRFEIVLGRFLGYSALMTLVLIAMTGLSLLYLVWEVDPDAAAESLKAREPVWGDELLFEGTGNEKSGINVGKEWGYRSYISGPMVGQPSNTAYWQFNSVPSSFANRKSVRCEYTFDVFRSTKGYEGKGISVGFYFRTWRYQRGNEKLYQKELEERRNQKDRPSDIDILNELSEKYGYYEVPATAVSSFHTYSLDLPGGLFKSVAAGPDPHRKEEAAITKQALVPLEVRVQCHSVTQYIGLAKYDFWLRQDDPDGGHDKLWFAYNFFKAQAVNLWLKILLVIGLSVALSTYLSGVIGLLVGLVVYGCGAFILNFVQSVAFGKNYGGGPALAAWSLFHRQLPGVEPTQDATVQTLLVSDDFVRFGLRRVLDMFPDVDRFDFTRFVEEGFNIPESQILINFLLMAAYVLPWIVLAYYLMKWKEVASAT
jgi:ABC-type transport system involved in multi-copper enzyme maturation permease subunit